MQKDAPSSLSCIVRDNNEDVGRTLISIQKVIKQLIVSVLLLRFIWASLLQLGRSSCSHVFTSRFEEERHKSWLKSLQQTMSSDDVLSSRKSLLAPRIKESLFAHLC